MATPKPSLLLQLRRLTLDNKALSQTQTRHASHASEGRANRAARGPGKRLGAKKGAMEPVVPGNIIFRQRGSLWFPGENCVMGRDHTISALQKGFVRYYRDPARNPKRKYIGVVFEQHESLPRNPMLPRRRRLGMLAVPRTDHAEPTTTADGIVRTELGREGVVDGVQRNAADLNAFGVDATPAKRPRVSFRQSFKYRMTNTEIGKIGQRTREKLKNENRRKKKLVNLRKRSKATGLQALQASGLSARGRTSGKRKGQKGKSGKR